MEYVEVRGKTVEIAVEAALEELGIDPDRADIEVIQEPEKGFLGMGGKDAFVRVKVRSQKRRRRRRRGGDERKDSNRQRDERESGPQKAKTRNNDRDSRRGEPRSEAPGGGRHERQRQKPRNDQPKKEATEVSIEEQAPVVESFLKGLVDAFGLEGTVSVTIEDDVIVADVSGPQTEAMVGPRGSTIEAIHELTKTVLQRQTQASARVRLDIAGYAERRRQALAIYADQLIDQVLEEGGEVMLEPMSAGDQKTIHDAVAKREGVRSYSEGEAPQRFVVIAALGGDEEE
ncbi:MAG: RNA-binding cell elongation regulator Jag/EloR [Acidimicrobiia bacterium]